MTQERNWAEHDRKLRENPSLEEAAALGRSHSGYGWSCTPWGHWTEEQKAAYTNGWHGRNLEAK